MWKTHPNNVNSSSAAKNVLNVNTFGNQLNFIDIWCFNFPKKKVKKIFGIKKLRPIFTA